MHNVKMNFQLESNNLIIRKDNIELACFDFSKFGGVISDFQYTENFGMITIDNENGTFVPATATSSESLQDGIKVIGTFCDEEKNEWTFTAYQDCNKVKFAFENEKYSEVRICLKTPQDELIYGFGEQFSNLDFSNKKFYLCAQEPGLGRGDEPISSFISSVMPSAAGNQYTAYAPQPVILTSNYRGINIEQETIYTMDVKKSYPEYTSIQGFTKKLSGNLFFEENPLDLVESMTCETGRLRALPDFAYDTILGVRGGKVIVEEILENCLKHNTPVSAIWIEDWEGRLGKNGGPPLWWRWYPDENLYPDFKNWVKGLNERGIKVLGYVNPFLTADDRNPLFLEAVEHGYLIKRPDGTDWIDDRPMQPDIRSTVVDLTNPEAYQWLKEKMRVGMIENGLSGWMADFAEHSRLGSDSFCGDRYLAHAITPTLWAKLNYELLQETDNLGKFYIFHRSAGAGSNKYATSYWCGDQCPTYGKNSGLLSSVNALITSGLSGMSINHSDIGGFLTLVDPNFPQFKVVRTKDVMFRWMEFAAFTPIYRTHDGAYANPETYQFYYDDEGYAFYARMARLHSALKWYFKELEVDVVNKGYPMCRAMWLHYPNDKECQTLKHQYLLGEDILVAPIDHENATSIRVYLPKGSWVCPHTDIIYDGGKYIDLPAKEGYPSVLIRGESSKKEKLINTIKSVLK